MIILGLDPGATTGWCLYDSAARRVLGSGHFRESQTPDGCRYLWRECAHIALERPRGYGPTRPQVVDAAFVAGVLAGSLSLWRPVAEVDRIAVRRALADAVHGAVRVRDDASVWAALVLLHGEGSDKRATKREPVAGPIGGVTSHARAALAVAWTLADSLARERAVLAQGG